MHTYQETMHNGIGKLYNILSQILKHFLISRGTWHVWKIRWLSKWWQKYSLIDKSYFPISFSTQTMKHVMIWYLKAEYDISEMHISVLDIHVLLWKWLSDCWFFYINQEEIRIRRMHVIIMLTLQKPTHNILLNGFFFY